MTQRTLEVFLKYGMDEGAYKKLLASEGSLRAEAQKLTTLEKHYAREVAETEKAIRRKGKATDEDTSKLVEQRRQLEETRKAAREARAAMFDDMAADVEESTQMLRTYADKWEGWGDILQGVGDTALAAGGSILALATVSTAAYVQKAGLAEKTSADWLATQGRLEQANLRVGRVTTSALLPTLEKVADLAEDAARFAEAHPEMVDAGIKAAGGLVLAGGLVKAAGVLSEIAGRGIRLVQDIREGQVAAMQLAAARQMDAAATKQLAAAGGMQQGAGMSKAGAAALGGYAGAATGGVVAGLAGYEYVRKTEAGQGFTGWMARQYQRAGIGANEEGAGLGEIATVATRFASPGLLPVVGILDGVATALGKGTPVADALTKSVGEMTGAIEKADDAARSAAGGVGEAGERFISQQAVDVFIQYRRDVDRAWKEYDEGKAEVQARRDEQLADEKDSFEQAKGELAAAREGLADLEKLPKGGEVAKQWNKLLDGWVKADVKAQATRDTRIGEITEDAEKRRTETIARAAEERARAEEEAARRVADIQEDYLREQERSRDEFQLDEKRLIAEGDVLGLQRLREDRALQEKFAKEDVENAVADEREQAAREATEREKALEEQLRTIEDERDARIASERETYAVTRKEREAELAEWLDDTTAQLNEQHEAELGQIEQQARDELAALEENRAAQLTALEEGLGEQLAMLDENLLGEQELKRAYYAQMTADLETWLDSNAKMAREKLYSASPTAAAADTAYRSLSRTSGRPRARAGGGYADHGLYTLGEEGREFVLSADTTRAMERRLGALSQQNVLTGSIGGSVGISFGAIPPLRIELTGDGASRVIESDALSLAVVEKLVPSLRRAIRAGAV